MAFVPDASVAAAWLLPDEKAALADLALDRMADETANVPSLFWHELQNLLLSAERRGRIAAEYADASMARVRHLPILCSGEAEDHLVLTLARRHRLTGRVGGWRGDCRVRWLFRCFRSGPQSVSLGPVSRPPLIKPDVRISRIRLSDEIMPSRSERPRFAA